MASLHSHSHSHSHSPLIRPFQSQSQNICKRNPPNRISVSSIVTEDDFLDAIGQSDGSSLPALRSFENDSFRLSLSGPVDSLQALSAASSDGGGVAAGYVSRGLDAMVVETSLRGPVHDRSTVSTRIGLPVRKVIEKAKDLRSGLNKDILFGTQSENILALTFKQVVLAQLWTVELLVYRPGTKRNMENLNDPREVPTCALISSDDRILSVLAEVICGITLESTEKLFLDNQWSMSQNSFFRLFRKPSRFSSKDMSVFIDKLYDDEIIGSAQSLFKTFKSMKENYKPFEMTKRNTWWSLSTYFKLKEIGGPEFCTWVNEYVPAYSLQIDPTRFLNLDLEGWRQVEGNRCEVLLTQSQMVDLANVLDMYYEDVYTLPGKLLSCSATAKSTNFASYKKTVSLLKMLSITFASGVVLVILGILGQLHLPSLHNGKMFPLENRSIQASIAHDVQHQLIEATKVEEFCVSIVHRIKDAFSWIGDVRTEKSLGACIGDVPVYLKSFYNGKISSTSSPLKESDEELKASAQDIASYQVVMSGEGRIIGFQPTSRVAVNQWADNPLAKELYGGRKLSPGIIEPGLKIPRPDEVAVIELLMSTNPDSSFALARPSQ